MNTLKQNFSNQKSCIQLQLSQKEKGVMTQA